MEPINYLAQVADPFAQSLQGLQLGAGMVELQQKQAAMVQQQQRQQLAAQEQAKFFTNPNPTMRDAARYASLLSPEQANAFRPFMEGISKEQQQGTLNSTGRILSALQTNPEIGIKLLQDSATAARNSGDNQDAALFDDMAAAAADPKRGPAIVFKSLAARTAGIPGAKEFFENIDKSLSTARAEDLAPEVKREAIAKADAAEAEAITKLATADNAEDRQAAESDLARAQADRARIEADYQKQITLADINKKAAELGLTNAQKNKVLVETSQLSIAIKKAVLELKALEASGGLDPAKAFDQEEKLRKEYQARNKVYSELGTTYSNIESSSKAKSGPGDIALITGFMKMLDPGSVVRETEFATARDTAGLYTRLENSLKKAESGQFLQPKQREEFVNLAKQYLDSAQKKAGEDRKALGVVVKNYKLNPDNVFGPETTATNDPNIVIVGGRNYTRPANFNDAQWTEYKKSVGAQ